MISILKKISLRKLLESEPQKMLTEVKNQPFSLDVELTRKLENLMIEQLRFDQVETYPWTSEEIVKQL